MDTAENSNAVKPKQAWRKANSLCSSCKSFTSIHPGKKQPMDQIVGYCVVHRASRFRFSCCEAWVKKAKRA
jgi:hypothetical protein